MIQTLQEVIEGRTPLHFAAQFGHLHIVKYLTEEHDCNPSCLDEHKYTPLTCTAVKGHKRCKISYGGEVLHVTQCVEISNSYTGSTRWPHRDSKVPHS